MVFHDGVPAVFIIAALAVRQKTLPRAVLAHYLEFVSRVGIDASVIHRHLLHCDAAADLLIGDLLHLAGVQIRRKVEPALLIRKLAHDQSDVALRLDGSKHRI